MAVRITNLLLTSPISLPNPVDDNLRPRQTKEYPYIECDKLLNDQRIVDLVNKDVILVECLDDATGDFVSQWNLEPKLRLTPYVFWVDALGFFRMKNSNPTFDLDGVVIGPGAGGPVPPHGPTHIFTGTDPVPQIEVLEGLWSCTVTEQVGDAVFENVANAVRQSNASSTATMPVIGIVISKPTPTTCVIARSGEVAVFAGLTVGQEYYASTTPGQLTTTIPTISGQVAQYVGYARNTTTLVVQLRDPLVRA